MALFGAAGMLVTGFAVPRVARNADWRGADVRVVELADAAAAPVSVPSVKRVAAATQVAAPVAVPVIRDVDPQSLAFSAAPVAVLAAPATMSGDRAEVIVVGDIMLSRSVASSMKAAKDVNFPYVHLRDALRGADVAFANLETPITAGRVIKPMEMTFRTDPEAVAGLVDAGFDVLSLANNHTPNFGERGLLDTVRFLDDAGILHAGAGKDVAAALAPAITEAGGVRIAWLAFNDQDVVPATYGAAEDRAGTAIMDVGRLMTAVADAKTRADLVFVSMHSGFEYAQGANARQTAFAHAAVDAGAAAVIGHHPHVVQPYEEYKGRPILYSLGNFIFDQGFSQQTRDGLMAVLSVDKGGVRRVQLRPIHDFAFYGQPQPADAPAERRILARLQTPATMLHQFAWTTAAETPNVPTASYAAYTLGPSPECGRRAFPAAGADAYIAIGGPSASGVSAEATASCGDGHVRVWRDDGTQVKQLWASAGGGYRRYDVRTRDGVTTINAETAPSGR